MDPSAPWFPAIHKWLRVNSGIDNLGPTHALNSHSPLALTVLARADESLNSEYFEDIKLPTFGSARVVSRNLQSLRWIEFREML